MRKKYDLNKKVKIYLEMTTIQHMKLYLKATQSLKPQEKNSCDCCYTYNKVNQTETCSMHSVSFVGG